MATNEGWVVTGIPETMRALKALDPEAAKELRKAMKAIAEVIVKGARGRMEFGPGAAASSLKAGGGVRGAWVSFPKGGPGSAGDPVGYYPWLDFGGGRVSGRGVSGQGDPSHAKWLGGFRRDTTMTGGRYIYPAIDDARRSGFIKDEAEKALLKAARNKNFRTEVR
jgi:hypothetical protein